MNTVETSPQSILVHVERFSLSKDLQLEAKEEFKELCMSSGAGVCAEVSCKIDRPSPNYFVKLGKLNEIKELVKVNKCCLLYTSPSPRDKRQSRMPSSA